MDNNDTILVVDDDEYLRDAIKAVLQNEGYNIITAKDGRAALAALESQLPELIILDLMMPGIGGLETCERIRNIPGTSTIPIIILTQLNDTESISDAFKLGATDFLTKPLNWVLLSQRIKYSLHNSKLSNALISKEDELNQAQRIAKLGTFKILIEKNEIELSDLCAEMFLLDSSVKTIKLSAFEDCVAESDRAHFDFTLNEAMRDKTFFIIEIGLQAKPGNEIIVVMQGEYQPSDNDDESKAASGSYIGTVQDVTESRLARDNLEYQRYYDPLTDLLNRKSFELQVRHFLLNPPDDSLFAVVFIGLDHFSHINDNLGHSGGDIALKEIATRLHEFERQGYVVSRFGGDVFSLLVKNLGHIDDSDRILEHILTIIREPIQINTHEMFITASVGASIFPIESEDSTELIKGAEAAMLQSRQNGGNRYTYRTVDMNKQARMRVEMERDLRAGLDNDEFVVYYQPQIDAKTLNIIGMEALVRWKHKVNGLISPLQFIPLAEESGLIIPIGERVLYDASKQTKKWNDMGFNLVVGVNLSPQQFEEKRLLDVVADTLQQAALPANLLELEVTENMAINNMLASIESLTRLREMGIKTSMDDFGTGYSSLSQLQQLPIDTLKIDQAFIRPIVLNKLTDEYENVAIASAVIAMAHSLGLKVIAEGVETSEQCDFLRQQGCDILQGYLFGRPMTAKEFEKILLDEKKHVSDQLISQQPLHC